MRNGDSRMGKMSRKKYNIQSNRWDSINYQHGMKCRTMEMYSMNPAAFFPSLYVIRININFSIQFARFSEYVMDRWEMGNEKSLRFTMQWNYIASSLFLLLFPIADMINILYIFFALQESMAGVMYRVSYIINDSSLVDYSAFIVITECARLLFRKHKKKLPENFNI